MTSSVTRSTLEGAYLRWRTFHNVGNARWAKITFEEFLGVVCLPLNLGGTFKNDSDLYFSDRAATKINALNGPHWETVIKAYKAKYD